MIDRWVTDNDPSLRYPIYTRANVGEVFPDPVTPMTGSLGLMTGGEQGWRDAYVRTGALTYDEFERDRPNTVGCFGGYGYLNMSLTRIYGVRMPGMTPEMVDFQYFGEMPGIAPYTDEARPTDEDANATALLQRFLSEQVLGRDRLPELDLDRRQVERVVATRPDFGNLHDQELVDRARMLVPLYRRLFCRHISVSGASGVGTGMVAGVCDAIGDPALTMTLVAGIGDVDSAAPSYAMWDLGRMVAASERLTEAFDGGIEGLVARLAASGSDESRRFLVALRELLREFGSRGPNEWELRAPTWGTRPELVLAAVDRMRLAAEDRAPAVQRDIRTADAVRAADAVRTSLAGDPEALGQFEAGLRAARLFLAGRERTKTTIIKVVHEMRLALREVGRRLAEAGHVDAVEQIFMVTDDEIDELLERPAELAGLVRQRQRDYEELFTVEPPFVLDARQGIPPVSEWPRRVPDSSEPAHAGDVLAGIPGCAGTATGRARIVLDPSDPSALEPGDVLVAPITDPAWTPLFVSAAAVVVDVGAQVSHAVIVSRELGIPCVVSVTGATHRIPDGVTVTVDGAAGTVTVH